MTVETKIFGGAYFPKDKALKKMPDLKPLAISVKASTRAIAEAVIFGKLAAEHPLHIDDYFKVKIWEHRDDLPCPALDVFSSNFFGVFAEWSVNAGEPVTIQPETEEKDEWTENEDREELKSVRLMDLHSRAACMALFGGIEQITMAQYGQVVDLLNDDDGSFQRELAEALTKEPRAVELSAERKEQLLAWVRKTMKVSTQWPDIKKGITKWLDTPPDKREPVTPSDITPDTQATLGGGNQTDRSPGMVHNLATLRLETAIGILAVAMDFDIYAIPSEIMHRAKEMESKGSDPRFTAWWNKLRGTPGILDFSRAAIIALIKTAPEDLYLKPLDLRAYINRNLVESNHAKPDQKTVDIACGNIKREMHNVETQSSEEGKAELPAVCPGKAAQLDKELKEAFAETSAPEQQNTDQPRVENLGGGVFSVDALMNNSPSNEVEKTEVPPALNGREIEIAHALNDLLSGRTNHIHPDDVEGVLSLTDGLVSNVLPLLISDIATTEFCLSPDLTDEEIHDVAVSILEEWSDDISVRQKIALDAIVEYRRTSAPKVQNQGSVNQELVQIPESVNHAPAAASITYRQQLILAAMQGMCANPSYRCDFDDLPAMAIELADSVINQEGF